MTLKKPEIKYSIHNSRLRHHTYMFLDSHCLLWCLVFQEFTEETSFYQFVHCHILILMITKLFYNILQSLCTFRRFVRWVISIKFKKHTLRPQFITSKSKSKIFSYLRHILCVLNPRTGSNTIAVARSSLSESSFGVIEKTRFCSIIFDDIDEDTLCPPPPPTLLIPTVDLMLTPLPAASDIDSVARTIPKFVELVPSTHLPSSSFPKMIHQAG